jgi:hypothetical protein
MTLALSLAAVAAAFLAGVAIGLYEQQKARRQVRPAGPFDPARHYLTACDISLECPRWRATGGACCPDGTVRHDCPSLFI